MRSLLFPSSSARLLSVPFSYLPGPSLSLHFLCRPYSSSTSRPFPDHLPLQQGQDELAFSDQETLRTIDTVKSREDDKGSKTLSFVSYTKSEPLRITSSSLSKAELCSTYQIHPRNLGIVDMSQALQIGQYTTNASAEATIVPLKSVILVNLLYVKALLTDHEVLLFSPVPRTRTRAGTGTRTHDRRSSPRSTPESGVEPESEPEPIRIATTIRTTMGPTMGTPGTETSLRVENDAVKAKSIDSNGEAEEDVLHKVFGQHLEQRLARDSNDPFEHRALESLLTSLANIFESELALLVSRIDTLVHDLAEDITREELNRLLGLRGAVGEFLGRTIGIRRAIDRLLSEDADLAAAYLTAKATASPRKTADHEELELLLENYSQRFEGIITGVSGALARIKSNQDVVELSLASTRNKLLQLELKMSLCTVGLTLGAFGASLLGMNLTNHFEDDPMAFYQVTAGLIAMTTVVGALGIRALRRISRAGLGSLARIGSRSRR